MGRILAVMNIKGGVGKTTITGNLAHALGRLGHRVLAVDMDSQCNTTSLLLPGDPPRPNTLHDLLAQDAPARPVRQSVVATRLENVSILPNTPATADLEAPLLEGAPSSYAGPRQGLRDLAPGGISPSPSSTIPPTMGEILRAPVPVRRRRTGLSFP